MNHDGNAAGIGVGERLRALRRGAGLTLDDLAGRTGISKSTLSRLETGERKLALEHLTILADEYGVSLDDLVGRPSAPDPRVRLEPRVVGGRTVVPLTRQADPVQAWQIELPASHRPPDPRAHAGFEWFYVLRGKVRLIVGEQDLILSRGEAVEFDTSVPHWFGSTGHGDAEILSLFSRDGRRVHLRTDPATGVPSDTDHPPH